VVTVIIEIKKGNGQEKEIVISVIVIGNVDLEKCQFMKGTVSVIDFGKQKEKKNHHLEEGNFLLF